MTARERPAAWALPVRSEEPADRSPVVVLTYAYAGTSRIQRLLADGDLAWTSGTGLLPLCAQAAAAWQRIDNHEGPPSSLALASIRALASSMITVILAGTGRSRWCEISYSPPGAAETFLRLYPDARFVCLHRSCPDVIRAGIEANPWDLAGAGFGAFTAAYPGNSAAALAAYWAECTESVLGFQQAHPAACRQVRYEDMDGRPDQEAQGMFAFLGLDPAVSPASGAAAAADGETSTLLDGAIVPASSLPGSLAERVNDLQQRLGYLPIT
jgi:hypothetical protein